VLDPVQDELSDASGQREGSELRLWRVRRKDFHLPLAQILGFSQIDQPAQMEPDFHVLCWYLVIVVEQVENQSPTVGFPSQLAQHIIARLQTEARPLCCVFGARRNSRLRVSGPDDDGRAGGEREYVIAMDGDLQHNPGGNPSVPCMSLQRLQLMRGFARCTCSKHHGSLGQQSSSGLRLALICATAIARAGSAPACLGSAGERISKSPASASYE